MAFVPKKDYIYREFYDRNTDRNTLKQMMNRFSAALRGTKGGQHR